VSKRRLGVVVMGLLIALGAVLWRCVDLMVFEHEQWATKARRQHQRLITAPSPRGEIRSADGYVLATSLSRVAIQVDTHELAQLGYTELFVSAAAPLLQTDAGELLRRLDSGARAVWLAQMVDHQTGAEIRSLAPSAVVLVPDSQRTYPLGSLAAPIVGFVGREELTIIGRAGFEHHYDALLAGEPTRFRAVRDAVQRQLRLQPLSQGRAGYDLELTIHARLQARCESVLEQARASNRALAASAVVLEAHTGRILSLVSVPSFDPAHPPLDPARWRLRPVQDALEPGSTIKPFVVAAALSSAVFTLDQRIDCQDRGIMVAGSWIRDHADPGLYSLREIIAYSSNTGAIKVAQGIEQPALWDMLRAFGFGERTKVGFPAEASGLVNPLAAWTTMSSAGIAIGQELTVTPLQLALAYAAIANGGWLCKPMLVRRAGAQEQPGAQETVLRRRVMDSSLALQLQGMLQMAVEQGTGELAQLPGLGAAGKTGTAQKAVEGGFDNSHHVSWFAGFFPMPGPRYVVVVTLEEPTKDYWAAHVAAPVFARLATATADLMGLPLPNQGQRT